MTAIDSLLGIWDCQGDTVQTSRLETLKGTASTLQAAGVKCRSWMMVHFCWDFLTVRACSVQASKLEALGGTA